jgi:flagellar biosynthesis protein FlhG
VITNQVADIDEASEIFLKLSRATVKFLNKQIEYLGHIQYDRNMSEAVKFQRPVLEEFPRSQSSLDFVRLSRLLQNRLFLGKAVRPAEENRTV